MPDAFEQMDAETRRSWVATEIMGWHQDKNPFSVAGVGPPCWYDPTQSKPSFFEQIEKVQ